MASQKAILEDYNYLTRLFILIGLIILGGIIATFVGVLIMMLTFDNVSLSYLLSDQIINNVNALKMLQMFSTIGVFILPACLYAYLNSSQRLFKALSLDVKINPRHILLAFLITLLAIPCISKLAEWNQTISLPDFLQGLETWMTEAEKKAEQMLKLFMVMPTWQDLAINLLMVGVLPAIGEELLFRGIMQPLFGKWLKNMHLGIWIAALIFSAFHMQFYGFFPRMLLGVLFGYFFYWSGSLLIPIIIHFLFNSSQVIMTYLHQHHYIEIDIDKVDSGSITLTFITAGLSALAMYYMYLISHGKKLEKNIQHY